MQIDRTPCPGCSSEQPFVPQTRYLDDRGKLEVFIRCGVCPYRKVLRVSTIEMEAVRKRLSRHIKLAARQRQRFGAVSGQTARAIGNLDHKLAQMQAQLDRES